nr:hypothetical protein [Tanacetum cinerariifolium]
MIIKRDSKIVKAKVERKSLALKVKKESSNEECSTSGSEAEEYAMAVRYFKKLFKRRECPKPPKDKNPRAFVRVSWSDSGEEDDEKVKNKTCLVAQASSEICLGVDLEPDGWIKDSGCSKHMMGNRKLFSSYKVYNEGKICDNKCGVTFSERDSEITKDEPTNVNEALADKSWIVAMQEELNQFIANDVWELVPQPRNTTIIGTKWVFRNKLDENGNVSRNKARILLAYACALDFKLFQMDVKSAFLNGFINEEVIMPRKSSEDHKNTRQYIPMISHEYCPPIKERLRNLESRYIHEGRVGFENFADLNYVWSLFHFVEFECLLEINDQIYPRLILEFYSQYQINCFDEGQMFIEFVIQNQFFSYSLEEFAQILDIPCEGSCVFTDKWSLDELVNGVPKDGPYQINHPSPDDIISSIRIDREGQVCCIRHEEEINVHEYQILTREIVPTLKPLEEIIQKNVFCLGGNRDHVPSYVLYDRVMTPLTAQYERKTRKDRGTRRGHHSNSSSSAFDHPSSSHLNDDDDGNDKGTSCASTPSAIRFVSSLTNEVTQVFQNPPNIDPHLEPFYTLQTEIINHQV